MVISIIAAMTRDGTIGRNGAIPWYYASDMSRFRRLTWGKTIIMGRKTWDSLKSKPLLGRKNVVLSHQALTLPEGVRLASSLAAALEGEKGEVMVVGGAHVYQQALPMVSRMYLTLVEKECAGDTSFPPWYKSQWVTTYEEKEPGAYQFFVLERPWKYYSYYPGHLAHHGAFAMATDHDCPLVESEVE